MNSVTTTKLFSFRATSVEKSEEIEFDELNLS